MEALKYFETLETIEMIAATLAHEVKNPLSLIQANIDFIQLDSKNEKYSKNFSVIKKEIKRANEMLLDFINLMKNLYRFDEDVEMYDIIMDIVENYKDSISKEIEFKVDCPDKNLYFVGNRHLFSLVLSNIIKNSIEAIANEGVIEISAICKNNRIILTVKDTGEGLSEDIIEKLNGNETVTSKEYGSGIGVNICKNIISEHKGTYEIFSFGEKKGCLVTITLPA